MIPAQVNVIAFDPVQLGWLYAGTDTGLYVSRDDGLGWQRLESIQTTHKLTVAIAVDSQFVFASMYDGAGTPVQVFRLTRDGTLTTTGFPDGNAATFSVDTANHRLYVGSASGVYWSDNEGQNWQGGGRGAGTFTSRVVAVQDTVWQLSADGLYRSRDSGQSWNRLAGPADLNNTYYGSSMHLSGLAVSGNTAYYGAWSIGFPYQFLAAYAGSGAQTVFDGHVNDVLITTGHLWIATNDGVWVNDALIGSQAAVRRPVLIIPGILGSLPTSESLKSYASAIVEEGYWDRAYKTPLELDPINHTYDALIKYLLARGYRRDQSLFLLPYYWLQDNAKTAQQLAAKLYDIRQACGCSQVDLVTHSMGGLIARSYIQSDTYQGDVANLIQIATPNAGSVEDYSVWESGEHDGNITTNRLLGAVLKILTVPQIDFAKVVVLHQLAPSLAQLLPLFDYLEGRHYPNGYPRNTFLEGLNQPADIARLKQRIALYIVGGNTFPTLQSLRVDPSHPGDLVWPDGKIEGSSFGIGDTTVLQSSLEAIDKASLLLDANHGGVVTAAAPFVARTLMGGDIGASDNVDSGGDGAPMQHYLLIYAQGNVALHLRFATGQGIDDTAITVPGAYYSGSGVVPQMMAIPNPGNAVYHLTVTGSGSYTIGMITDGAEPASGASSAGSIAAGESQSFTLMPGNGRLQSDSEGSGEASLEVRPSAMSLDLLRPRSFLTASGSLTIPSLDMPVVASSRAWPSPATTHHRDEPGFRHWPGWIWIFGVLVLLAVLILLL